MSDSVEVFRDMRDARKALRAAYGQPCPECVRKLPRAQPTILLPQHRCRIHGYVDPRPELTDEQDEAVTGWRRVDAEAGG